MVYMENSFVKWNPDENQLICKGEWIFNNFAKIKKELKKIAWPKTGIIIIDGQDITKMDSAGAWLLTVGIKKNYARKVQPELVHFSEQHQKIFSLYNKEKTPQNIPKIEILGWIQQLGKYFLEQVRGFYEYCNFIGKLTFEMIRVFYNPVIWRWRTVVSVINRNGTQALPIIGLLSFMIGIVISYQMGNELQKYGANIFIVDLMGFSVLREFGPLLTAIMVAGRTGSAFTAQLGIMKINQEIDALDTMGITPEQLLLLPRLIGLIVILPLLTIWADIFGIIGGMVMAQNFLNITWHEFLNRFQNEIPLRNLMIGLGKAPVFAMIIASIGCFQGMKVSGSAVSVGTRTTKSVVLAIFFIIIVNAVIAIILSKFKL